MAERQREQQAKGTTQVMPAGHDSAPTTSIEQQMADALLDAFDEPVDESKEQLAAHRLAAVMAWHVGAADNYHQRGERDKAVRMQMIARVLFGTARGLGDNRVLGALDTCAQSVVTEDELSVLELPDLEDAKSAATKLTVIVGAFLATGDMLAANPRFAALISAIVTGLWPLTDDIGAAVGNLRTREERGMARALAVGLRGALQAPTFAALRARLPVTAFHDETLTKVSEAIVATLGRSSQGRTNETLARHVVLAGLRAMGFDKPKNLFSRDQIPETEADATAEPGAALGSELLLVMGVALARAETRKSRGG